MPTALIVEDEPEANRLLAMLVQLRGYATISAFTGGEALEKIRDRPPDIVFLDLMLPDINGYEICRSLKTQRTTSLIPVVMVTARIALENRLQSFCMGADQYVAKPYTPDQIFHAMAAADAWRRETQGTCEEGEIPFKVGEDGETLRLLAQLRSLLVARTPLAVEVVCRITESLQDLWRSSEAWGRQHGIGFVASLSYRLGRDRLSFTLRDTSGWLRDHRPLAEERWPKSFALAGFDELTRDDAGERVSFVKRYDGGGAADLG